MWWKWKKCCLAADDTVIASRATEDNLREIVNTLDEFYNSSGLKVNYNKSVIVRLGLWCHSHEKLEVENDFVWAQPGEQVQYLGIFLSAMPQIVDVNEHVSMCAEDIASATKGLRYQNMSIIGCVLTLKALVNSKLVYKWLNYPTPSDIVFKTINNLFYDYVRGGRHRMSMKVMEYPVEKGGFNMVNVVWQNFSLKLQWISRILQNAEEKAFWELYLRNSIIIKLEHFLQCNLLPRSMYKMLRHQTSFPPFWRGLFSKWFWLQYVQGITKDSLMCLIIKLKIKDYHSIAQDTVNSGTSHCING